MVSALCFKHSGQGNVIGSFDLQYHGLFIIGATLVTGDKGLRIELPKRESEFLGGTIYIEQMYLTPREAKHVCELVLADLHAKGHIEGPVSGNTRGEG